MTKRYVVYSAPLAAALVFCSGASAIEVSSADAVRIATEYLRHYHVGVRSLKTSVELRSEPGGDATDRAVHKKLTHRRHWWVYFTPRNPDVYGGAHSIYIAPETGEVIGWCSER
jgi:hypothetical protein